MQLVYNILHLHHMRQKSATRTLHWWRQNDKDFGANAGAIFNNIYKQCCEIEAFMKRNSFIS